MRAAAGDRCVACRVAPWQVPELRMIAACTSSQQRFFCWRARSQEARPKKPLGFVRICSCVIRFIYSFCEE